MKLGVVGLGNMGQHHARLYSQMGLLVAVADSNPERAREMGELYGVYYTHCYQDLFYMVDAVSVVVPTTLHQKVAVDFLSQGVHVLVEKPIAFHTTEAQEMVGAALRKGVNLAVGHIEHFNPAVVKLKEVIDSGTLGKLLTISTRRVGPFVPRVRDVGVVIDSATHDIGVLCYLLGKAPRTVFSRTGNERSNKEDYAFMTLDFGETIGAIEVNWFTPHKVRTLTATGTNGVASLDYIEQTLVIRNSHDLTVCDVENCEPLKLELEDFIQSIEQHRPPKVNGKQGLDILRIALEGTRK